MLGFIALSLLALIAYIVGRLALKFLTNLRNAKRSGIPYIIIPVYHLERWWLITHQAFFPLFRRLPTNWTKWVDYTLPQWGFDYSIVSFERVGADTFYTVAPGGLTLYTCDPAVINQITTRRNDFPKPTAIYKSLDIYGKNVVSTEGSAWRQHRKAVSPPFTEKNNHLVWDETIKQAQSMLTSWVGSDGKGHRTVDRMMDDTMRLSLNVISSAGFGRTMEWPKEGSEHKTDASYIDPSKIQNQADDTDPGHTMSYTYAIHCLLDNILLQFLLPRWLLERFPNRTVQKANEAYREWGIYMQELLNNRKNDIESGKGKGGKDDILTQLVQDQVVQKNSKTAPLKESEILGNMFTLILAGHETAANSIHFAILYLALYPESQRNLHKDLDSILKGRTPDRWDYDEDLPQLFGGMPGAILAEELRLCPPVIGIPKSTIGVATEQKLMVEGKECLVPPDTYVPLAIICAHKHPKHWPHGPARLPGGHTAHPLSNLDNDLEEFRPERWLKADHADNVNGLPVESLAGGADDALNVNQSSDTSDKLMKPKKGAYSPFSEGFRACIGRRFAQVEVLATIAVIFQKYSVELAVDKYATDMQLRSMDAGEKSEVWQKAAEDARELLLHNMQVIITLQIRNGTVPFRFVPRGEENFPVNVDEIWKNRNPDKINPKGDPNWSFWR